MINPESALRKEVFNKPLVDSKELLELPTITNKEKVVFKNLTEAFRKQHIFDFFDPEKFLVHSTNWKTKKSIEILGPGRTEEKYRTVLLNTIDKLKGFSNEKTISEMSIVNNCKAYFLNQIKIDSLRRLFDSKKDLEKKSTDEIDKAREENMIIAKEFHRFIRNNIGRNISEYSKFIDILKNTFRSYAYWYCQYAENKGRGLGNIEKLSDESKAKAEKMEYIANSLIRNIEGMNQVANYLEKGGFEVFYPSEKIDQYEKVDLVGYNQEKNMILLCQVKSEKSNNIDNFRNRVKIINIKESNLPTDEEKRSIILGKSNGYQIRKIERDWKTIFEFLDKKVKKDPGFNEESVRAVWIKTWV